MTPTQRRTTYMNWSKTESWSFAADHRLPESLATRLDAAVAVLRAEVLEDAK